MEESGRERDGEAQLERRVKEALLSHTESAGLDVRVEAYGRTVRLYGTVDTLSQKEAAGAIARRVPGVEEVRNDLTVAAEPGWTDSESARELRARFARNPETREVTPRIDRGRAELLGTVPREEVAGEARHMAAGVAGVREVRSRLEVASGGESGQARAARTARARLEQRGLGPDRFTVWIEDGTLHVRGLVASQDEVDQVRQALSGLPGVRRIEALLPLDPSTGSGNGTGAGNRPGAGAGPAAGTEFGGSSLYVWSS